MLHLVTHHYTVCVTLIIIEPAYATFPRHGKRKYVKSSNTVTEEWFNRSCWVKRQDYHKAKHRHTREKSEESQKNMVAKSKAYKREISKACKQKKWESAQKLKQLRSRDPKEYWKLLRGSKSEDPPCVD